MYQIDGREVLFDWLAKESNPDRRQAVLDWLVDLAADPLASAHRVPGIRAPVYISVIPSKPPVVMKYLVADPFFTIKLIAFDELA